jgi:hypothetical protein
MNYKLIVCNITITMNTIFHGDIFDYIIVDYLNVKDLYRLHKIDKHFTHFIEKVVIREINRRLSVVFGDNLSQFKKVFEDTKNVISGSFITQCILGEKWKDSDIDIYTSIKGNEIEKDGFTYNKTEDFIYGVMKYKDVGHTARSGYSHNLDTDNVKIVDVRDYEIDDSKVQIIKVNVGKGYDEMKEFIYDTFDFDFCKNIYSIKDGKECVTIYNIDEIISKDVEFKVGFRLGSSIERCLKYKKREFKFTNLDNLDYIDLINKNFDQTIKTINNEQLTCIFKIQPDGLEYKIMDEKRFRKVLSKYERYAGGISNGIINYNCGLGFKINGDKIDIYDKIGHKCGKTKKCLITFCGSNDRHIHYHYRRHIEFIFVIK